MLNPPRHDAIARKSGRAKRVAALLAGDFTHAQKSVLVSLALRYSSLGFEIPESTIVAETSLSRSTVRRTIRALEAQIVIIRSPGRGRASTLWFLNPEPDNPAATREFVRHATQRTFARKCGWEAEALRRQVSRRKRAMEARQAARAARPRDAKAFDDWWPNIDDDGRSPFELDDPSPALEPRNRDETSPF